jgi:hypothetical protein
MSMTTRFPKAPTKARLLFVRIASVLTATSLSLAIASGASAASFTVGTLTLVPDKPLAATPACAPLVAQQTANGSVNFPGGEVEPFVATDPTNPRHLIGVFQQDRWNDGGANGLTTVVSTNGGTSWTLATKQPLFSTCAGATAGSPGDLPRATDPWVSISPKGVAFQVSDSFIQQGPAFGGDSRILVSVSTDGGLTWGTPTTLLDTPVPDALNDKESVTADPTNANRVYAVWDQLISPSTHASPDAFLHTFAFRGPTFFASTSDGGQTWQQGHKIFDPGQNNQTIGNQIVVLPNGTLLDGFDLIFSTASKSGRFASENQVALIRSTDHGATWSDPTIVSLLTDANVSTLDGQAVRTGDILPGWAVNSATGTVYVTWQDGSFSSDGHAQIAFSQSTDGGLHWSTPVRINKVTTTQAFTPQIFVSPDGTVGVTYYDMRNATASAPGQTNYFMVHCSANCTSPANWTENLLDSGGGFDMKTAPLTLEGYFTGDYEGLTSVGTTFVPFVVLAKPEAKNGPSDAFSVRVGP